MKKLRAGEIKWYTSVLSIAMGDNVKAAGGDLDPFERALRSMQRVKVVTERSRWPAYYTFILLVVAAVFISYVDRTNIAVGAIAMQAQLGWNETQKGLVLSSFYFGYLALMLASGVLANRYGGEIVLGIAVIFWSLFTVLTPPAALISLSALVVARIALGAGEAALLPSSVNMIGRWVPASQRSRAMALWLWVSIYRPISSG